ncbi:hypothetical protein U1Q18_012371 [Sarracenia purpurea var. burkii]
MGFTQKNPCPDHFPPSAFQKFTAKAPQTSPSPSSENFSVSLSSSCSSKPSVRKSPEARERPLLLEVVMAAVAKELALVTVWRKANYDYQRKHDFDERQGKNPLQYGSSGTGLQSQHFDSKLPILKSNEKLRRVEASNVDSEWN